jgi:hypothetical protein
MISIALMLFFTGLLLASIKASSGDGIGGSLTGLGCVLIINLFSILVSDEDFYANRKYSNYLKSETIVEFNDTAYTDNGTIYEFDKNMKNLWRKEKDGKYELASWKILEEHLVPDERGIEPKWYLVNYESDIGLVVLVRRKQWIFIKRWDE